MAFRRRTALPGFRYRGRETNDQLRVRCQVKVKCERLCKQRGKDYHDDVCVSGTVGGGNSGADNRFWLNVLLRLVAFLQSFHPIFDDRSMVRFYENFKEKRGSM